jgi:hypothetical protein
VNVRRLGPGDERVVERLAEQALPARVSELLADERTIFLVAFEDEQEEPIGFVLAYELLRRHGARISRARGIRHGFVLTNATNEAAMALYRSVGGVRPNPDDVLFDFDF